MADRQQRYSGGAMLLHWLIALALAAEIGIGFGMPRDASGFAMYQLHKSIGITILVLSIARLLWRLNHDRPPPAEGGITGWLANAVHFGFYAFMIVMPLTGWVLVSTAPVDVPTVLFGMIPLPHLPLPEGLNALAERTHELLAWGGLALFGLHVAGAARHQILLKDRLLARMSPGGKGTFAWIMSAVTVCLGLLMLMRAGDDPALNGPFQAEEEETPPTVAIAPDEDQFVTSDEPAADAQELAEPEGDSADTAQAEQAAVAADDAEEAAPAGPPPDWAIQPGGRLSFNVENAGTAVSGAFSRWTGTIAMDPANPATAQIRVEVDLASASLGDATQDRMLAGSNFLASSANPTAVWRSDSVRSLGNGRFEADGTLTLKGTSRPQRIAFTLGGEGPMRSVQGRAAIDRNAFGVGIGENAANLAPTVALVFSFDAVRR